jgi:hypothetical protein
VFAQDFDRYNDVINECTVIKYYEPKNQLNLQKCIPFDSTKTPYYRLGIYVKPQNVLYEQFMRRGAMIVLDDSSRIRFPNETQIIALGNDSYQISAIMDLSSDDLQKLIDFRIKRFKVHNYWFEFDKWQPKKIQDAFIKIANEK